MNIEMGLVIGEPWIDLILAGEKTWEIRSKPNKRTGRIALAQKGGPLVATCVIGKSIGPISPDKFDKHFKKHRVSAKEREAFYGNRSVYAWPLSDVKKLDPPVKYKHPGGGSWVKLKKIS